jgi:hypothetical protein
MTSRVTEPPQSRFGIDMHWLPLCAWGGFVGPRSNRARFRLRGKRTGPWESLKGAETVDLVSGQASPSITLP